jgi:cell wall-associated NlpC family hydrolase
VAPRSHSSRRAVAAVALLGALLAGALVPIGAAGAAPAPSGTALGTRDLGVLNERYNLTRMRLQEATEALQTLEQQVESTRTKVAGVKALVQARAARLYRGAAGGGVTGVLDVGDVNELGRRTQYVDAAAKPDRALMHDLSKTLDRLAAEQQSAEAARTRLKAEADAAAAARKKLMAEAAAAAAANRTQSGDGAGPVGTPRAMMVASSGSSTRTGTAPSATPKPVPTTTPPPGPSTPPPTSAPTPPPTSSPAPPPSSRAAVAVAYARAQLGKPYVFATAGPNTFDCSGLTMAAWRAAGVSMAHYSGSQATAFPRVSWSQLQPGDIVVFYSDWHHVGLYVGGGTMIHAPQTGDVVKYAPAWRETFQFGVRPG